MHRKGVVQEKLVDTNSLNLEHLITQIRRDVCARAKNVIHDRFIVIGHRSFTYFFDVFNIHVLLGE